MTTRDKVSICLVLVTGSLTAISVLSILAVFLELVYSDLQVARLSSLCVICIGHLLHSAEPVEVPAEASLLFGLDRLHRVSLVSHRVPRLVADHLFVATFGLDVLLLRMRIALLQSCNHCALV